MQTIITDNIKAIQHICKQHHVKEMSVFGSVTKDDFNENSDVAVSYTHLTLPTTSRV